jgi:creatinine amidohydrolase
MINSFLEMNGYYFKQHKFSKAVLAIGSAEYHGDHLPYGTDTIVAEYLAKQTSSHFDDLLLLPTIPIGMSQHHSSFPIAISLSTETLMRVLNEVFDSLNKHNIKRLLIINGHDGNIPAIQAATKEYRTKNPEFKIIILEAWWETAAKLLPKDTFQVWGGLGHAGEGETSMMLYIKPELVNFDIAKGVIPNLPENIQYTWLFGEITPYGATGDPRKATDQKGEKMNKVLTKLLVDCVKEMDEKDWEI